MHIKGKLTKPKQTAKPLADPDALVPGIPDHVKDGSPRLSSLVPSCCLIRILRVSWKLPPPPMVAVAAIGVEMRVGALRTVRTTSERTTVRAIIARSKVRPESICRGCARPRSTTIPGACGLMTNHTNAVG